MPVQNGDKVVYSKYAGTELKVQGGDFVLLKVRHSRCIIAIQLLHSLSLVPVLSSSRYLMKSYISMISLAMVESSSSIALIHPLQTCVWEAQEEDVIGVLNSTDIAQLLPIGDRILVEVRHCSLVVMRAISPGCMNTPA